MSELQSLEKTRTRLLREIQELSRQLKDVNRAIAILLTANRTDRAPRIRPLAMQGLPR